MYRGNKGIWAPIWAEYFNEDGTSVQTGAVIFRRKGHYHAKGGANRPQYAKPGDGGPMTNDEFNRYIAKLFRKR